MNEDRNYLKDIRIEKGYTQQEVADMIGVTKATISKYEKGQRRINHVEQLSKIYGVSPTYILTGKRESEWDSKNLNNGIDIEYINKLYSEEVDMAVSRFCEDYKSQRQIAEAISETNAEGLDRYILGLRIGFLQARSIQPPNPSTLIAAGVEVEIAELLFKFSQYSPEDQETMLNAMRRIHQKELENNEEV